MTPPIVPISELPRAAIEAYLVSRGFTPDVVHWKFYDESVSRGRERGYAWFENGRVQGFMGLMPAWLGRDGQRWPMDWTVDWSAEAPNERPGRGVRLFKHAIERCDQLMFASRGSEHMWNYASRLSQQVIPDAGRIFLLPLRVGYLIDWLGRRAGFLRRRRWPALGSVALPLAGAPRGAPALRIAPGIARELEPLLEAERGPGWYPHYDFAYVDWVLGRCPLLECASVWAGSEAGAVVWRLRENSHAWRLALWGRSGASLALRAVLAEAARHARRNGGVLLSVLISHLDGDFRSALRAQRWLAARQPSPLLMLTRRIEPVNDLSRLSYLDVDLAHQMGNLHPSR